MKRVQSSAIRRSIQSSFRTSHLLAKEIHTLPPKDEDVLPRTIASGLQEHIISLTPRYGLNLHAYLIKSGFRPDLNISIKLLILHLKCGCLRYARQVLDEIPKPSLSAYNYMINGYLKHGMPDELMCLVSRMIYSGEKPDAFTLSMILKASTCSSSPVILPRSLCRIVHACIVRLDIKQDDVLCTALVYSYVKNGRLKYARSVFDMVLDVNLICSTSMISGYMNQGLVADAEEVFNKTVEKDIVVYNAMIEGYSKSAKTSKNALEVYISMQRVGFCPNISTFASIVGACAVLSAVEVGIQIHGQLAKTEFYAHIKMGSSLLDMYAKCGRVKSARRVFDEMQEKNVFSWTSMIDGYGKNGNPDEALKLFYKMQEISLKPNYVTFLGALSACSHSGLIDEGRGIFESMERDFHMKPKMEHYACMVDLLGRAGSLNQAWEFVMGMPEKPNSDVWAALLGSSRLHGDLELANVAANELFKLNADDRPGAYMALSNTLAAAGKWDNVSELREVMKARGISKITGQSSFGVENFR